MDILSVYGMACLWQRRIAVRGRRWWPSPASSAPLRSPTRAGPSHLVLKTELDVVRSPLRIRFVWGSRHLAVHSSVADPDPSDPYVFGPPGSGSVSQMYRSGSFHHQAKIVRKTLIPTVLWFLFDFLSLKNYVNVPSKSNKQKNCYKLVFCWGLEGQGRK